MGGRRWTKKEDDALFDGIGVFSIPWFQRKAGKSYDYPHAPLRSRKAIYSRAARRLGTGSLTRGTHTLIAAARETGYSRGQIQRAQSALNQKWKRLSTRGPYLITFDQLDEIIGWLRQDYWCMKLHLYGCVNCGDKQRPSAGMGLCQWCYRRLRGLLRRLDLPTQPKKILILMQSMDEPPLEMRAFVQRAKADLGRGWSLDEKQIRTLAAMLGK